jgi:hypothetical protein
MSARDRKPAGGFLGFEHKLEPIATPREFNRRLFRVTTATFGVLTVWLAVGVLGYHGFAHMNWVDSVYNASMIMGGMGPVGDLPDDTAKLFASAYAIYCGVVLLVSVGLLISPLFHRLLHHFHIDAKD